LGLDAERELRAVRHGRHGAVPVRGDRAIRPIGLLAACGLGPADAGKCGDRQRERGNGDEA
jgi:hypothetical protein